MLGIAGLVHAHSWLSPYQNKTASFNQDMFLIKKKKKQNCLRGFLGDFLFCIIG